MRQVFSGWGTMLALAVALAGAAEDKGPLLTRRAYSVPGPVVTAAREAMRSADAERYFARRASTSDDPMSDALEYLFQRMGVAFPAGSRVEWNPVLQEAMMVNTDPNHERLGRSLAVPEEWQVEVTATFAHFKTEDLAPFCRSRPSAAPMPEELLQLLKDQKGQILHSLSGIGRHGQSIEMSAGDEVQYADGLAAGSGATVSNATSVAGGAPAVSVRVQSRKTGLRLSARVRVEDNLRTIQVDLGPEISSVPEWRKTTLPLVRPGAAPDALTLELPVVHARSLSAGLLIADGATVPLGGMPDRSGENSTYVFITARLLDADGRPMVKHDWKGRLVP